MMKFDHRRLRCFAAMTSSPGVFPVVDLTSLSDTAAVGHFGCLY